MHRIVYLICWKGKYPWYFPYFLHSRRYNPTVDFLVFTDNNDPNRELPPNVMMIPFSIEQFNTEADKASGFEVVVASGYKLCDFKESLEYANCYFNAIYLEKGKTAAWQLYSEWFERGKALKESFFADLHLEMTNPLIEVEFQKHASWKEQTLLRATPTIIVNGYKLPDNYKIEDLRYFTEFNVDVK